MIRYISILYCLEPNIYKVINYPKSFVLKKNYIKNDYISAASGIASLVALIGGLAVGAAGGSKFIYVS